MATLYYQISITGQNKEGERKTIELIPGKLSDLKSIARLLKTGIPFSNPAQAARKKRSVPLPTPAFQYGYNLEEYPYNNLLNFLYIG